MIRQRGRSWQVDTYINDKRIRKSFSSLADAEDFEETIANRSKLGLKVTHLMSAKNTSLTLKGLTDTVYEAIWKDTPNGINALRNCELIQRIIGTNFKVDDISTIVIDEIVQDLKVKGNSNGTINNKMSALMVCLKYAHERDWIKQVPRFKRFRASEGRLRYFTPEEEAMIYETSERLGQYDFTSFVKTLIDTGLRTGELCRVKFKDIVKRDGKWVLYVWARGGSYRTKNGEMRTIPLTDRVVEIIENMWKRFDNTLDHPTLQNVALSKIHRDKTIWSYTKSNIRTRWNNIRNQLGYMEDEEFVPHLCRHTCATRLVQAGVPLIAVKEWMGHKSIQVTMRYAKLAPEQLFSALDALNQSRKIS